MNERFFKLIPKPKWEEIEAHPSDQHNIADHEDLAHIPTPGCPCRPQLVGIINGKRLFEHNELYPLH